ncbi:MAG TPA: BPSL0067 family protein [Pirellulaceae bacterium]|nr:BPSL0067 family protein [Pirellulaceae bacterium]
MKRTIIPVLISVFAVTAFASYSSAQTEYRTAIRAHIDYLRPLRDPANYGDFQCEGDSYYYKYSAPDLPKSNRTSWTCGPTTYDDMVQVADNFDVGQCVNFIKAVSETLHISANFDWRPGPDVIKADGKLPESISSGSVIATFTDGRYDGGHAAVVLRRVDDYTLEVADQNWISDRDRAQAVGKHEMTVTGLGGITDLSEYSFVTYEEGF